MFIWVDTLKDQNFPQGQNFTIEKGAFGDFDICLKNTKCDVLEHKKIGGCHGVKMQNYGFHIHVLFLGNFTKSGMMKI